MNAITGLFSSPKQPQVIQSPAAPTPADPSVQLAARDAATAAATAAGRGSTILTGGQGDTSVAPVARKVLLGG
jgi:hypothetical protein